MTAAGARRRFLRTGALAGLVFCAGLPGSALAQDPQPPPVPPPQEPPVQVDTLRTDTIPAAPADSVEAAESTDSVRPAVLFPLMPRTVLARPAATEWVWNRAALLREAAVTLIDLLERVPGIVTIRSGTFVQPEVASAFGGTAGRTEIEMDGFILDPLAASTFDLSQITLAELREVRVQRRLGLLRIVLTTEYAESHQPYSRVEAGIGVPPANLFRGLFLAPHVIVGPLGMAIERVNTEGIGRAEPASVFNGWLKWSWTSAERGVQFEMQHRTLEREPNSPWLVDRTRQDMVLRARNRFAPGVVGEVYFGGSTLDEKVSRMMPDPDDPDAPDVETELRLEQESLQAGVRMGLAGTHGSLDASVRYRSLDQLPAVEGRLDGLVGVGLLRVAGELGVASWREHDSKVYSSLRGELGPLYGLAVFGEMTNGTRGAPAYPFTIGTSVNGRDAWFTDRSGWRAGVSLDATRARGTVAFVRIDQDVTVPFGLPFDLLPDTAGGGPIPVGTANGIEAGGRIEVWRGRFALSSWITDWHDTPGWTWLPSRTWRTALELHWLPLPSGNLEIFGRAEAHMRGSTRVPDPLAEPGAIAFRTLPAFTTADAYLQIRIIDVRAFIRWEDVLGNDIEEVPGRIYRGQRIFYGVKWDLWN